MTEPVFLHQIADFSELIEKLAQVNNIRAQLVEKDYWLMHCLWALQNTELKFELKGGTSLSKGWGIINRFSEDVDIKIFPPNTMSVASGKNHVKPRHRKSREAYFNWLLGLLNVADASSIERDPEFDDHDLRNAGFRIGYRSLFEPLAGLKTNILLEVGFDVTTPNAPHDISSWAYDYAIKSGVVIKDNRALAVPCYLPEYTLVEKLAAISKKYRQEISGRSVQNFTRHYYDVYQLLGEKRVQDFIGTQAYVKHKADRFGRADERDLARNAAFSMPDLEIRDRFADRLGRSSGLYFRGQPSFAEIIERIQSFAGRL